MAINLRTRKVAMYIDYHDTYTTNTLAMTKTNNKKQTKTNNINILIEIQINIGQTVNK